MKRNDLTIDLNNLNTRQLEQVLDIVYHYENEEKHEQVLDRIKFVKGMFNEKQEKEYIEKFL